MTTMHHAMPEATALYSVTAVVVVGLVVWVLVVLRTAKEPWARARLPHVGETTAAVEHDATADDADQAPPTTDTDSTAKAPSEAQSSGEAAAADERAVADQEDEAKVGESTGEA